MNRTDLICLILLLITLLLGEAYQVVHSPEVRLRAWFLASDLEQDIEWYIKDTGEALSWIIVLVAVYLRERKPLMRSIITVFIWYRIADLGLYWLNYKQNTSAWPVLYGAMCIYIIAILLSHYFDKRQKTGYETTGHGI